ncbi:hypothetical protein Sste5346_009795 [Sporothrix stenoceras]|uniref:Uncharacterized protein n=1 Tax=Sporothrix stenoceras TaxID=5173 RepID=A0ABR3YIV0_9PEZI
MVLNTTQRRQAPSASLLFTLLLACSLVDGTSAAAVLDHQPRAAPSAHSTRAAAPGSAVVAAPLTTVPYRTLNVVPWPLPTAFPDEVRLGQRQSPRQFGAADLFPRQSDNTICGYIGGDPDLPATCSAGSHCVLDAEHGAVGCCPNGVYSCTAGVFTGCVDGGSDNTEVNPYVYTCGGGSFCYKNSFPGGYYQYGCGSASTLGQSVAATASGMSALAISSERITFTGTFTATTTSSTKTSSKTTSSKTASSSSTKTTSSKTKSSSTKTTSSSTTSSSSSSTPSSSSSSPTKSSSTSSSSATPSNGASLSTDPGNEANTGVNSGDRAGVIIGATISGVAGLIAIIALIVFFCWKKRRNGVNYTTRKGPSNFRGASGSFQALRSTPDDFEHGLLNPEMAMAGATGTYTHISAGGPPPPRPPPPGDYDNPFRPGGGGGDGPDGNNGGNRGSGGSNDDDGGAWATPAIGPAAMAAAAVSNSLTPNRRSSAGNNSLLSREPSRRSSYRGVVTTAGPSAPGITSVSGSIVSRAASNAAVYNQISQQSPYYDANSQPPPQPPLPISPQQPQHTYGNINSNYQPTHPDDMLMDSDRVPLNREFDEFTRGYQDVLSRIGEEDPSELSQSASQNNSTNQNSEPQASDSLLPRNISNVGTSNTLGTERDSSGVLPPSHQPPSMNNLNNLNLRGGGSSGIASSDSRSSVQGSSMTTSNSGRSLGTATGTNRGSMASISGSGASLGVDNRASTNSGQQLSLNMTSPSLSIDGQLVGVGGVSPPAATLTAGADGTVKTLSPPASPLGTMRPLWQQNRQKSRNLMWS